MPELPEVQTMVNDLKEQHLIGAKIIALKVFWPGSVNSVSKHTINKYLVGRTFGQISRRGKYIVFVLDGEGLALLHLRMAGRLVVVSRNACRSKHEHVIFVFDNGMDLRLHDTRKFARLYIGKDTEGRLEKLGVEPLDKQFIPKVLKRILTTKKRMLKPLLLDQTVIAGLGNIYVDEALWEAGLHPTQASDTLNERDILKLHRAIRLVLRRGIRHCGTSLGHGLNNFVSVSQQRGFNHSYLKAYQRQGKPCPRCQKPIRRIVVAQRSTHICPCCQK